MQWIADRVRDQIPDQLRFEFGLWTLRIIGQLIERQFNMTLSLPKPGNVMKRLRFTPQRPLHRAYEQDANSCSVGTPMSSQDSRRAPRPGEH